jgi:class 3 adenylate cyclase
MVTGTATQPSPTGAGALLAHLRLHPEDLRRSPTDLATQFELSDAFVRTVLEGVQTPRTGRRFRKTTRPIKEFFHRLWDAARHLLSGISRKPTLFCVVTIVVWGLLIFLVPYFVPGRSINIAKPNETGAIKVGYQGIVYASIDILAVLVLYTSYFWLGRSRFVLQSGLAIFLIACLQGAINSVTQSNTTTGAIAMFLATSLAYFMLTGIFVAFGCLISVIGGWFWMKRAQREIANLSRHELLSRYFNIEQRLQTAVATPVAPPPKLIAALQRRPFLYAFFCGLTLGAVGIVVTRFTGVDISGNVIPPAWFLIYGLGVSFISVTLYITLTFLAGKPGRAALTSLAWSLGGSISLFFPLPKSLSEKLPLVNVFLWHCVSMAAYAGIGSLIGLGALVQRQAQRDRMLARNDQATLLAELLQLQYFLSEGTTQVCVLVVDAAKSAAMKASMDSMIVEFSFRAYQAWIARISQAHNGRVYTVTGDGAIVAFATCGEALYAAHEMQADVERFNKEENRLTTPFRLRIGLHLGDVAADIDKVEFTEVIDIAAHVEGKAPIGGIAVTETVVNQLAGYHFEPLADDVDGYRVLLARDRVTP